VIAITNQLGLLLAQAAGSGAGQAPATNNALMIWAIVAFGTAFVLLGAEAFVPSGGILGFAALISAIIGIVLFFWFDTMWGMAATALTLIAFPFVVTGLLWIAPNTFVGRMLTLDAQQEPATLAAGGAGDLGEIAVGLRGVAESDLRPVGACRLAGARHDCISEFGTILAGSDVEVTIIDGTTIRVRSIETGAT